MHPCPLGLHDHALHHGLHHARGRPVGDTNDHYQGACCMLGRCQGISLHTFVAPIHTLYMAYLSTTATAAFAWCGCGNAVGCRRHILRGTSARQRHRGSWACRGVDRVVHCVVDHWKSMSHRQHVRTNHLIGLLTPGAGPSALGACGAGAPGGGPGGGRGGCGTLGGGGVYPEERHQVTKCPSAHMPDRT